MNYRDCINSVISIEPQNLDFLLLLFPSFSYTDYGIKSRKFISVYDVSSKIERLNISSSYDDYIIISTRIFDFEVTNMDLLEMVLQFRQEHFRSRKRSLPIDPHSQTFYNDLYVS